MPHRRQIPRPPVGDDQDVLLTLLLLVPLTVLALVGAVWLLVH